MAVINHGRKQVRFKIVYCGTPFGGKTSNLMYVHQRLGPSQRGDMISVATAANRTLFFDYLPVNAVEIGGYETRFQLYTVPGQRIYDQTREIVLRGADGLVFVADSAPEREDENIEALSVTAEVLNRLGQSMSSLPLVFQHNKRDLAHALPLSVMERTLNRRGLPAFPGVATTGYQVFATLEAVTQAVLKRFHQSLRYAAAEPAAAPMANPAVVCRNAVPGSVVARPGPGADAASGLPAPTRFSGSPNPGSPNPSSPRPPSELLSTS